MGRWFVFCVKRSKNMKILGFYLVMVSILPSGDIDGKVIDYFSDPYECVAEGQWEEENSPFGIGFVCIEDVVDATEVK